jgi:adenosylcobyric acid synthase
MVLGTASHVGKSITVAALCRSLVNRGITVAPFKSQNMSLNSFVTADGKEIGIAQAMQAFAARTEPEADMNPVLLKPKGDRTSQVVLLGKPYRDVQIGDYYQETDALLGEAVAAYRRLEKKFGSIVVEGAGGAAELNLYDRDIANILLARSLGLPIVLVGDIERGGVFAQIVGTIRLLPDDIRPLVVGIIINKFRGDPALFNGGTRRIEELTGVPVLGVVPHADIPLPSEDSLSIGDKKRRSSPVRIGIVRFPRISNFTDFEVLERHAAVDYVPLGASLDPYDCIILPGTKNTVEDLLAVRGSGMAEEILEARRRGVPVIGICGGYQMLGTVIIDEGVESRTGRYPGIGLLDIETRFSAYEKTTVQVCRSASRAGPILSGIGEVKGYEIHMGESVRGRHEPAFSDEGAVNEDGLVFGTYMHGLFENVNMVNALLSYLYRGKGLAYEAVPASQASSAYDALADHFEAHVDMEYIASFFKNNSDGRRMSGSQNEEE